ncbi:MAG: UDP-N-acetylmuramoyl-tripeptide--D-alanyl-D-alanine ligase [Candidatus Magasanikbacteria bacterium]|nr:UDP-N-acetylmuramoyl-tripeptide--D-alanyl-D-alanine ligase [Candidatus Magasanikbacteria bacterium]
MLISILHYFLKKFSSAIIRKYHPDVIGITGSVGKTSAKEAIRMVLESRFDVRASAKNYNNQVGVPLTIIGVAKTPGHSILGWFMVFAQALRLLIVRDANYPKTLVLEMGADRPGDIQYLTEMAPCTVGVLTAISHAHTEFFKTIKKIAQEKRIIISHLRRDGFAVLNFDNELVMEEAGATKAEVLTYGLKEGAAIRATDVNVLCDASGFRPTGLNFKVHYKGNIVPVFLPGALSESLIPSALAAIAVGSIFGINLVEAAESLRQFVSLPGHLRLLSGIKNTLLIDDTYNSSPVAAKAALDTLASIPVPAGSERYAVLGDMLELGPETETAHREIGFKVAELGIDFLITVGEASKITAAAAREAGFEEHRIARFDNSAAAGKFLQEQLNTGDIILVKGSQGSRMEKIVKEVMAEPLEAATLLVRQEESWMNKP